MTIQDKLTHLRRQMKAHRIDYYLIPSADAHQSEYTPPHWKSRAWISGFTGSAGTVIVSLDAAYLWADGRYHIQAMQQIEGTEFSLFKLGLDGVPDFAEWLGSQMKPGQVCGFDGRTISISQFRNLSKACCAEDVRFRGDLDLIGDIWQDRPAMPQGKAFEHALCYAGKSRGEKLAEIRALLAEKQADSTLIASLDDIAWLMNLRGSDIENTPLLSAYAYVSQNEAVLFAPCEKLEDELFTSLEQDGILIRSYDNVFDFIAELAPQCVFLSPDRVSIRLRDRLPEHCTVQEGLDISTDLKSIKNSVELQNIEQTQVKDGVAMVRFLIWLKEAVGHEALEEADIHDKLLSLRAEQEGNRGASFGTIAGYEENAALMHYAPIKGQSKPLAARHMLLVDCGGQYLGGTTDITRTIILGEISPSMREDFTTVLKSHIALAKARFLQGCTGVNLDSFARQPMWERGLDYKCGTGHGLGYFLSVHEGPQNFSPYAARGSAVLKEGMLITNEPGIYRENLWGIRTENTLLVRRDETNENGTFLSFDTISYCPIDLDGIDPAMLTQAEKDWLNGYHANVYGKLSPHLTEAERRWLKINTRAI